MSVLKEYPFNTLLIDISDKTILEFHREGVSHSAKIQLNLTIVLHSTDCVVLSSPVRGTLQSNLFQDGKN